MAVPQLHEFACLATKRPPGPGDCITPQTVAEHLEQAAYCSAVRETHTTRVVLEGTLAPSLPAQQRRGQKSGRIEAMLTAGYCRSMANVTVGVAPRRRGQKAEKTSTHLCEHWFSILGDHRALIAVQRDKVVVERLLRMLQHIVELRSSTLEYTPEVPWNQRSANSFRRRRKGTITQKDLEPFVHLPSVH